VPQSGRHVDVTHSSPDNSWAPTPESPAHFKTHSGTHAPFTQQLWAAHWNNEAQRGELTHCKTNEQLFPRQLVQSCGPPSLAPPMPAVPPTPPVPKLHGQLFVMQSTRRSVTSSTPAAAAAWICVEQRLMQVPLATQFVEITHVTRFVHWGLPTHLLKYGSQVLQRQVPQLSSPGV